MKSRKLPIFVSLVALVVGYAVYDYKSDQKQEVAKSEKALLFLMKPDQIQHLAFESKAGANFALQRTAEGWKFEAPLTETADQDAVTQFIDGIATEKSSAVLLEGSEVDWKIYGLDAPKMAVVLKDNLGNQTRFEISAKKNFQGDSYLKKGDEKKVYVAGGSWQQKAEKTVSDFRDRRIARVTPADLESIHFQHGKDKFSFHKREMNWVSTEKPDWKLDQNKVRKLITALSNNRIQKFDAKLDTSPLTTLTLLSKDNKKWVGQFGINKDKKHFLQVQDSGISGELQVDDANEIYRTSIDSLRDRAEPFQFHKEDVKKIEFTSEKMKFVLAHKAEAWEVVAGGDPNKNFMADQVKTFLGKLGGLEVLEFTDKKQDSRINQNRTHLVLKAADDKVVLDLKWGGSGSVKVAGQDRHFYWATTNLFPTVFSLAEDKTKELGVDQIWTEKAPPAANYGTPEKNH